MLVLTQAAAGLFVAAGAASAAGVKTSALAIAAFVILSFGLTSSILHLGKPLKAWRAFLGWRKSWLSREIIAFNTFGAVALLSILHPPSSLLAAVIGLLAVLTSAMVYVDTQRPLWSPRFVFTNFYGTTLLLGATFAAVILGFSGVPAHIVQMMVGTALAIRITLFVWRRWHWYSALRNPADPIHLNATTVRALIPWTMYARTILFVSSTVFGVMALLNVASAMPLWASLAAVTTVSSEIIVRYVFFVASASRRMPGGFAA